MSEAVEREFLVNDLAIHAREYGAGQATRVITLHGWLDNCASFHWLAPELENCHVIALDLAGHGHSQHRSAHGSYNIWDDCLDVIAIADQLGWQEFTLLGHSRGAIGSFLLAAAMGERVERLVLLDGIIVAPAEPGEAASQLGSYLKDQRANYGKAATPIPDFATALQRRCEKLGMVADDCQPLVERASRTEPDGTVRWRHDPRIFGASAVKLDQDQQDSFIDALAVPTLFLLAEKGFAQWQEMRDRVARNPHIDAREHAGGHHMHMEREHAASIAGIISQWLADG